jgi:hypothetical protein
MYPETDSEVLLMITRSRDWYPLPYIAIWNGSISAWQLLNIGTMLYERSSTIDLPWTIHTPIKSSRAFREGLRDRRRKMTRWNCDNGVARKLHRVGRRRSQTLFSNTLKQCTCSGNIRQADLTGQGGDETGRRAYQDGEDGGREHKSRPRLLRNVS